MLSQWSRPITDLKFLPGETIIDRWLRRFDESRRYLKRKRRGYYKARVENMTAADRRADALRKREERARKRCASATQGKCRA